MVFTGSVVFLVLILLVLLMICCCVCSRKNERVVRTKTSYHRRELRIVESSGLTPAEVVELVKLSRETNVDCAQLAAQARTTVYYSRVESGGVTVNNSLTVQGGIQDLRLSAGIKRGSIAQKTNAQNLPSRLPNKKAVRSSKSGSTADNSVQLSQRPNVRSLPSIERTPIASKTDKKHIAGGSASVNNTTLIDSSESGAVFVDCRQTLQDTQGSRNGNDSGVQLLSDVEVGRQAIVENAENEGQEGYFDFMWNSASCVIS